MRQGRFENWAGNVKKEGCTPHEPQTIEEICTFVSQVYEKRGGWFARLARHIHSVR